MTKIAGSAGNRQPRMDQRERILNLEPDNHVAYNLRQDPLQTPWGYIFRSLGLISLAVFPAIVCAHLAQTTANWQLFERSGSIITIAGLLFASRRYFQHTVTDLVAAQTHRGARFDSGKVLTDILAARRGLTLSAFGTLIWGWGIYLRWWSFVVLGLWMAFVVYRAFRDPVLHRREDELLSLIHLAPEATIENT
jgi:hypothetical protein